jgi:hydroxyethylthiazole kinase-like uncharacterized protein yjeF
LTQPLDGAWLRAHPLPAVKDGDKNERGRVLVVGGAEFVPGALRLTGEAALRAGAGKLQLATVRAAAMALAVHVPEAAMIALPADDDGEIAVEAVGLLAERLEECDTVVLGPGMSAGNATEEFVRGVLSYVKAGQTIVLDAAALTCCGDLANFLRDHEAHLIMTPHHGEMAYLTGRAVETIAQDPVTAAQTVARDFGALVALKGSRTIVASADGPAYLFEGGTSGLATSGSGDVLAGVIGGISARGADPVTAAGWGVFVHGAAGETLSSSAPIGFLARDLLPLIPGLIARGEGYAGELQVTRG